MPSPIYIQGVKKGLPDEALKSAIENVFLKSTNNLSWLKPGDIVLLKPAINSPDPYPATTHPFSISVIANILKDHGARVVVGDQSGIEHVVHGPNGIIKGNTKNNFIASGMSGSDADINFISFEEEGWNEGFHQFKSDQTKSWKDGFYISNWIQKADHIINLPRVSAHTLSSVTLGFKNAVGFLREDSRMEFHANGPLNSFIARAAKGSGINMQDDQTNTFIEKITEISLAIKEKLRLTLFTATQAQTTLGPDARVIHFFRSYIAKPSTGLVFASVDQVAAELFALAYLTELYRSETPFINKLVQKTIGSVNKQLKEFGKDSAINHPFIKHAVALGLGSLDIDPIYTDVPKDLQKLLSI